MKPSNLVGWAGLALAVGLALTRQSVDGDVGKMRSDALMFTGLAVAAIAWG